MPQPPSGRVSEADEEAAFAAVQEQIRARWQNGPNPPPAPDAVDPNEGEDDEAEADPGPVAHAPAPASAILRTAIAIIAGTALTIAAAGLWIGDRDLAGLPVVGEAMVRLAPPSPVAISVRGTMTLLPSGKRLLEVNGTIANRGKTGATVPPLAAVLSGPGGVALRWSIATPRITLPPGQQVGFTSTVTGFPEDARTLSVRQAR